MPIHACRLVRKMRGGAQAHLLEADDGHFYVVKFRNNPQHRRILVNELVASVLLRYLQINVPATAIVALSPQFLGEHPDLHLQLGDRRVPIEPGWHFGSRFPGHPERLAVYDFLPDALLDRVANPADFLAMVVCDKWLGNADARQAVFFRARVREWAPGLGAHPLQLGFIAMMVDHGYVFDGPHWGFPDSPLQGLYFRPQVYRAVDSLASFQPWLDQVLHFPDHVLDDALKQVPPQWLNGDSTALEELLESLYRRRRRVPDLIRDCLRGRVNPFPNWR